jgi:mediator of RNA polymerase II transcription subunit 14
VLVVTDERFQYALITTRILTESMYANMVLEDIAWLDVSRIHEDPVVNANPDKTTARVNINRKLEVHDQMEEGSNKPSFSGYVKVPISNFMLVTVV